MLSDLTISGFRCFRELRIPRLTRVNLFVGTNNAGKTSILEAAEILSLGTPEALQRSPLRRGELIPVQEDQRTILEIDPSHLFHGHSLEKNASFSLKGGHQRYKCLSVPDPSVQGTEGPYFSLQVQTTLWSGPIKLSWHNGLNARGRFPDTNSTAKYLGTATTDLSQLWDTVVLQPEETLVTEALQIINPAIERLALVGEPRRVERDFFVKLYGSEQRLPLGSFGDGLKRLLALALHVVSAKGGLTLVDEIDTGLHYTVMADMWRLVIQTARRLDVQVLASTHSLDCVRALAWVQEQSPELAADVTLHRVEKDATETVAYSMDELAVAARHHLEVR